MSDPLSPVVVALLASDPDRTTAALEAVAAQTAPVRATYVVGSGAGPEGDGRVGRVVDVVESADRDVTHIWLLHDDARPRPDALSALLRESERVDASVASSKLLDAEDEHRLESVGGATDVVGFPYTGLQPDEIDQEQYDVVRDVAFAPGASMLVRRDLLRGLRGPDPKLEPGAAEIDFSQRARLSGGRVIVVPSSEVLHEGSCRARVPTWRRVAGRYRATAKAYQWVTLLWVLPLALVLGLVEALIRTFTGRPLALVDELRAWIWNVIHLPSLISERRAVRRLVGDEELFRYQVGGSAGLRILGADLADRSRRRAEASGRPVGEWVARSVTIWQTPGFAAAIVLVVASLVAVRTGLLRDLPATGFALPLSIDSVDALRSAGGWWNLGGLGSATPLHPSVIPQALAGFLVSPDSARVAVLLATAAIGALGAWRLASVLELRASARLVGAVGLIAGPATAAALTQGHPAVLGSAACAPLLMATLIRPPRTTVWGRVGSVAGMSIGLGVAAWFAPLTLVAIPLAALVSMAAGLASWRRLGSLFLAVALAAGWSAPYLLFVSAETLVLGHGLFWDISLVIGALMAAAALLGIVAADESRVRVVGAGSLLLGLGVVASRLTGAGLGREVWSAGLVTAAIGVMLLSAGLVDGLGGERSWLNRMTHGLATLAAVALILWSSGPLVWSGTYGLPDTDWTERLEFAGARADLHGPDRILLLGEGLPGERRSVLGTPYRLLVSPGLEEAWIGPQQTGDVMLEDALRTMYESRPVRPGEVLAGFGIKWVVVEGSTPFDSTFEGVLDMRRLPIPDAAVFENLEPSPIASTETGVAWTMVGLGFEGPSAVSIDVRVNASAGWSPIDDRDGWAMVLDGSDGAVRFVPSPAIEFAGYGAAVLTVLVTGFWIGTRRRP